MFNARLAVVVVAAGVLLNPNVTADVLGVLDPNANDGGADALLAVVVAPNEIVGAVVFGVAVAPNENIGVFDVFEPNVLVTELIALVAGVVNEITLEGGAGVTAAVVAVMIDAAGLAEPYAGGCDGRVNAGNAFGVAPNVKLGIAAFVSSGLEVVPLSVAVGLLVNGNVNAVGNAVDVEGGENANPPRRGADSFDLLGVETTGANETLACGLSFVDIEATVVVDIIGDGVDSDKATGASGTIGLRTMLVVTVESLTASVVVTFVASVGTFKTDVVVAVLNVTDVFVVRFIDAAALADAFGSSAGFSSSSFVGFSSLAVLFVATLSTTSCDSSPRKKLNIIANLDF